MHTNELILLCGVVAVGTFLFNVQLIIVAWLYIFTCTICSLVLLG
jgi:hypothetical protein